MESYALLDNGTLVDTVDVQIGPRFLNLFSEHLYSSPNKAFEELVSNSWDAGARNVYISVPENIESSDRSIWVLDDGHSMDIEGFRALWSVATSKKRLQPDPSGRKQIGKFGVGKLATYILANQLTYICRSADGAIRAISMDYRLIEEHDQNALHIDKVPLQVLELTQAEFVETLNSFNIADDIIPLVEKEIPTVPRQIDYVSEYGGKEKEPVTFENTWTLVVLTEFKESGKSLQHGWLKRLLRTSLPLGSTFGISFNGESLHSAKSEAKIDREWVLGKEDLFTSIDVPDVGVRKVEFVSSPYPHAVIEGLGEVTGTVRLYEDKISGGKSESIDVSNGFFLNVRGRVIRPEDALFGLRDLNLSVLPLFRATVRADALDAALGVNRESLTEGAELATMRTFFRRLFNLARAHYQTTIDEGWPDTGTVLTEKWGIVPFQPLRHALMSAASDPESVSDFIALDGVENVDNAVELWRGDVEKNASAFLNEIEFEDLESDQPLVKYNLKTRSIVINKNHPFAREYSSNKEQAAIIRDTAIVEILTDSYLGELELSVETRREIRAYRDRVFRLVAQVRRKSAAQIAAMLREVTGHAKGLEVIVGDALEHLGYSVTRLGQSGEPEGVAKAILGIGADGHSHTYSFTYDAKSSQKGKASTGNINSGGLARHKEDYAAEFSLVVAPNFEKGALEKECVSLGITPIRADDLAELLVLTIEHGPFNLNTLRQLFELHDPDDVSEWVSGQQKALSQARKLDLSVLFDAMQAVIDEEEDSPDALGCGEIAKKCRQILQEKDFPSRDEVKRTLSGLHVAVPELITVSPPPGWDVYLAATPRQVRNAIKQQLNLLD